MPVVLVTGAQGRIGRVLSEGLGRLGMTLRSFDRSPGGAGSIVGDLADVDLLDSAMRGADCVVHLAGIPEEAPFADLLADNIRGTYHIFETARRVGVPRVVFASTNHVVGYHAGSDVLDERVETRPDTLYGVSKVFGEALGRLYHDKHGLEVVVVRIGSFRSRPRSHRELSTWLSHGDAVRLFARSIMATDVGFAIVYGVSANTRSLWRDRSAETLGYHPQDDAEVFANDVPAPRPSDRFHGGDYTEPDHSGGFPTDLDNR